MERTENYTDYEMCLLNKEYLEQLYIKDEKVQHVVSNDGCYIVFYEVYDEPELKIGQQVVTLHQSDEEKDSFVCIQLDDLQQIIKEIKRSY